MNLEHLIGQQINIPSDGLFKRLAVITWVGQGRLSCYIEVRYANNNSQTFDITALVHAIETHSQTFQEMI